jgi:DNA adenine methylase
MKPFLKWAGNKYKIIEHIKSKLPEGKRLIEPFLGSGAVFLNTDYKEYILSDINSDIINLYKILQKNGSDFIEKAEAFFIPENNNQEKYYEFRKTFNETDDICLKSALFIYLNKHCYNGLCRYNSKGKFNVPYGRYKKPYFPAEEMMFFHKKSQKAILKNDDFVTIMKKAKKGDILYCDPPYVPLSGTANFTDYSSGGFDLNQQKTLSHLAKELSSKGIPVLISNHFTEFIAEIYKGSEITRLKVQRYISCNGNNRNKAEEVLALFKKGCKYA